MMKWGRGKRWEDGGSFWGDRDGHGGVGNGEKRVGVSGVWDNGFLLSIAIFHVGLPA